MKLIQLLGHRRKSASAIYLAHAIEALGKRVLIVDATSDDEYKYSYIRTEEDELLYEIDNVEILIDAKSWSDVIKHLKFSNEVPENFDCIIVDTNDADTMYNDWPEFEHVLYVSDNNRFNILKDVRILNSYLDLTEQKRVRRIHFDSAFKMPPGYIELLLNNRVEFSNLSESIEFDDMEEKLVLHMQHEYEIPFKRLTKSYRNAIIAIVTEWFGIGDVDVNSGLKKRKSRGFFKKSKAQQLSHSKQLEVVASAKSNEFEIKKNENKSKNDLSQKQVLGG